MKVLIIKYQKINRNQIDSIEVLDAVDVPYSEPNYDDLLQAACGGSGGLTGKKGNVLGGHRILYRNYNRSDLAKVDSVKKIGVSIMVKSGVLKPEILIFFFDAIANYDALLAKMELLGSSIIDGASKELDDTNIDLKDIENVLIS